MGGREGGKERTEVIVLTHHVVVLDLEHDGLILSITRKAGKEGGREGGREGTYRRHRACPPRRGPMSSGMSCAISLYLHARLSLDPSLKSCLHSLLLPSFFPFSSSSYLSSSPAPSGMARSHVCNGAAPPACSGLSHSSTFAPPMCARPGCA